MRAFAARCFGRSGRTLLVLLGPLSFAACSGDRGAAGPAGEAGAQGQDGTNCTVTDQGDGSYIVTCDGETVTLYDGQSRLSGVTTST